MLSVDVQDVMGGHVVDYEGDMKKTRTDLNGKTKTDTYGRPLEMGNLKR